MNSDVDTALTRLETHSTGEAGLVSIYIPQERLIDEVIVFLDDEHTEAEEIRTEETRTDIQAALVRLQDELASYDRPPKNGMALFCGRLDDAWVEETLESPRPIEAFRYTCDETFNTETFRDLIAE
jgi:peptide chain release factor subunit 1